MARNETRDDEKPCLRFLVLAGLLAALLAACSQDEVPSSEILRPTSSAAAWTPMRKQKSANAFRTTSSGEISCAFVLNLLYWLLSRTRLSESVLATAEKRSTKIRHLSASHLSLSVYFLTVGSVYRRRGSLEGRLRLPRILRRASTDP